jgi:quercetin dioxygenase-like cupin family protein
MLRFCLLLLLVALSTPRSTAQDPVNVDPAIAKVEFENDRIRVLRVHYGPHQKLAMHEHPAKVAVCLTNFHMHRVGADGTSSEATCPAGSVSWREREKHAVENLDDSPAETVEIELKFARAPATVVPVGGSIPIDPQQIDLEPHHHVLFKNQYVEVMDVRIDPGDTTNFHTHAHDCIYIDLAQAQTQSQSKDKPWGATETSKPGQVEFDSDSQHPFSHQVKNVGSTPYHLISVELLP